MAKEDLLKVIQHNAKLEIEELRNEAVERIANLRKDYAQRIKMIRSDIRGQYARILEHAQQTGHFASQKIQLEKTTRARWDLAERCKGLAQTSLVHYWKRERETLLPILVKELPDIEWSEIRVAPDDYDLAKTNLKSSAVIARDPEMHGGIIAVSSQRNLVCTMDLYTLLDRVWPGMLPKLLKSLSDETQ